MLFRSVLLAIVLMSPPAWSAEDLPGDTPETSDSTNLSAQTPSGEITPEANQEAPTERILTVQEVLALAQALLDKGLIDEAEKAYSILLQSDTDQDVRTESAFQLGLISMARGKYRDAVLYFNSILNKNPNLPRVRLELARSYFLDKNYTDATLQFELVKGGELPPEVVVNIDAFLDAIRRQKNWTVDFSVNPISDSNITQESNREECGNYFGIILCNMDKVKKASGTGLNINVSMDYFRRLSQDWGLRTSTGLYITEYKGRRFDDYILYAALGPRYLWKSGEASLQPTFRSRWLTGKQYNTQYGLRLDGQQVFNRVILFGEASYTESRYHTPWINSVLRGPTWGLRLQPRYILNDRTFVQAGLEFQQESAREPIFANDNWITSADIYRILPYGFSVLLEGSLIQTKYHTSSIYTTKDYNFYETTRKDKTWGASVTLSSNLLEKYNLTPVLQYSYTHRTSNVWSKEYERNRLNFMLNLKV